MISFLICEVGMLIETASGGRRKDEVGIMHENKYRENHSGAFYIVANHRFSHFGLTMCITLLEAHPPPPPPGLVASGSFAGSGAGILRVGAEMGVGGERRVWELA